METILSIIALVISFLSAAISIWSANSSHKSYLLSKKESLAKEKEISAYIDEGYIFKNTKNEKIIGYKLTLSNNSSINNVFKSISLTVSFVRKNDSIGEIIFVHDISLKDKLKNELNSVFDIPEKIDSYDAVTKWALFKFDPSTFKHGKIKHYEISISDKFDKRKNIISYILKEFSNAN
ncbi:hypothetical protein EHQ16_19385 [Leptospira kanakyensis]|uniref:Uncharacterized protein n=1 Tax=Leptospira kanakyensis TaxID=2484968 RepID=A0A6N4Q5V5_9LEPT|nr:hypothetical protein [Leptospira kanakyensis]TGK51147.1 hypothetical protein EHQ11_09115 [Leptospira kanakyensis]TGK56373.1 hypothetical protein EHQ16_19385 [Leptospira kanakyensis]TGK65691.1 hypothetical protein EHQ18_19170 [Leptospira kanakyensis]